MTRTLLIPCLFLFAGAMAGLLFGSTPIASMDQRILLELRLPRLLFVLFVGGSLATIGNVYQVLFHNPLAEPFVLGVCNIVTLTLVCLEIFFHWSPESFFSQMIAMASALAYTSILLSQTYSSRGSEQRDSTILFGMSGSFVFSSLLFLLLSVHHQQLGGGNSIRWLFGQVRWLSWGQLGLVAFASLSQFALLFGMGRKLDALSLGDSVCRTLGVNPTCTRAACLFITSLFLAYLVTQTGIIGFVGVVVPHLVRLLFSPASLRQYLSLSFICGAGFLIFSDTVSRTLLPPYEFPIGALTAVLGGPLFLFLLWKK